ncbi:MAG TPA: hypothetical protein VJ438_05955, partial [Candidatus Nanoarchaeia archaeon]|nr:hypothetical protein [Candidatus Nanoarchaeia archaeon]
IHRHIFDGELIKLNAGGGVIDISKNHSVYAPNGRLVNAGRLILGKTISLLNERPLTWKWGLKDSGEIKFIGSEELGWLYGFFSAEGSVSDGETTFYNFNKERLLKCKRIIELNFQKKAFLGNGKNPRISLCDRRIALFFKNNFYTSQKLKRIPSFILNSNLKVKKAFLDGYNEGDGDTKSKRAKSKLNKYHSFTSNSQVLIQGLLFLVKQTTKQSYNLYTREDKPTIIQVNFCEKEKIKIIPNKIKKIIKIRYKGNLYDLSTESGKFYCGTGNILVHNTTGIYSKANPMKTIEKAWESF